MTTPANTRLVIADDHPLFRDALRQAVASVVASARIDEAGSFDDLTALLEQDSEVDLILLDLTMQHLLIVSRGGRRQARPALRGQYRRIGPATHRAALPISAS